MIRDSRIEVCPSVAQHRAEWYFPGPEWIAYTAVCGVCERLAYIGETKLSRDNFDKIKVPARATEEIAL
jgi:hypothetical protein